MQNDTADVIAAVGATQVTLHTREEARIAARAAAAVAVNIGTLEDNWMTSAREAVEVATEKGTPWVLDPVAAGFTDYRTTAARELLARRPSVLKANASEVLVLANAVVGGRAADSIHHVDQAADAACALAQQVGCIVVVSGDEDLVTDGTRRTRIANGHPLMGRMIGSGCMLTSLLACFLAVADRPFGAARAAVAYFCVAGEIAAARAGGPGTLKPLLIDALYGLDHQTFSSRARFRET